MVEKIGDFYKFDKYTNFQKNIYFEDPVLFFNNSLIKYEIQPDNKVNKVKVDREVNNGIFFNAGDYLHTYLTIDSEGIPDDTQFILYDEDDNILYSPFSPDGEYRMWMCTIIVNHVDVIPLPANYKDYNDWIDFEPGVYNWKLKSVETDYYESIEFDLQVEIR